MGKGKQEIWMEIQEEQRQMQERKAERLQAYMKLFKKVGDEDGKKNQ